jgi:hypothetical protein
MLFIYMLFNSQIRPVTTKQAGHNYMKIVVIIPGASFAILNVLIGVDVRNSVTAK